MTTSEIDPPAIGSAEEAGGSQPEERAAETVMPDGNGRPRNPPPTAVPTGKRPTYVPPPTESWPPPFSPPFPPPTGSWQPYAPPPTGGWQPYAPPPLGTPPQPDHGNGSGNGSPETPRGVWVRGRVITQLLSSSEFPGVWAWVHGLGWKRLGSSETGRGPLISLALLAKAYALTVAFHEDDSGQIDQLLV